jgi:hypothetical protein
MNHQLLYQWAEEIATRFRSLNSWQAANVALFSQGVRSEQAAAASSALRARWPVASGWTARPGG